MYDRTVVYYRTVGCMTGLCCVLQDCGLYDRTVVYYRTVGCMTGLLCITGLCCV